MGPTNGECPSSTLSNKKLKKITFSSCASRRQVEEIANDITLKLQAMKMYLEHLSIDEIGANLGVPKAIVEKWIDSFNVHQSNDSDCQMIYEIFDDSSVSTDRNDDAAKNAPDGESGSMTVLRWSESSDSEEMKNDAANEEHNEVTDAIKTDETPIISTMTLTPQLVANYKRADLKRWHDVPCRCTVCKEKFAGPNDLRLHVRQRHPIAQFSDSEITNSVKSYGCGLCFKVFDLFGKLVYHSVAAHVPQLRLR